MYQYQQLTPDSHKLTSCLPQPVCQSTSTDFNDLSRVLVNGSHYDGNATAWDWIGEYRSACDGHEN